jgi:hypothetical protein
MAEKALARRKPNVEKKHLPIRGAQIAFCLAR